MDKEDFVTYEQALALKKLGFLEKCISYYNEEGKFNYFSIESQNKGGHAFNNSSYINKLSCSAPTLAQAQKWLIEQGLFVEVFFNHFNSTWASSIDNLKTKEYIELKDCSTYEEVLSAGITECLKLLENK